MDAQMAPETMKIVSCQPSPAESQEKGRFLTLFLLFLEHFFIDCCDVLDVCFEDI